MRYVVAACVLGLITLEGLNTGAALEAQKNATTLVTHLATRFGVDAKMQKMVIDNLPYLRFIALSAFGVLVLRFHAFFLALYVLLTRAEGVCQRWTPLQKAFLANGAAKAAEAHYDDLRYILTTVGAVAYLLSICCTSCSSSRACGHAKAEADAAKTAHK